jgi:Sulfatase-modifying factor enzyme 1
MKIARETSGMRAALSGITAMAALVLMTSAAEAQGSKPLGKCAADAVISGTVCMDRYEASVWRVPDPKGANKALVKKIQLGKATAADLAASGATLLGIGVHDFAPCADNGQNCTDDIYAVSLPGVTPSSAITWFQAQAACENARKRLPSNAEWQVAAAGSPDPGSDDDATDCRTSSALLFGAVPTGSRSKCKSARGAFDMVGNLSEWVADWAPRSAACGLWSAGISGDDLQCMAGAATTQEPGALARGGNWTSSGLAGPFAVDALSGPSYFAGTIGLRCAR